MANEETKEPKYDKFSLEELNEMKRLPVINVSVGGKTCKALYDENKLLIYYLDEKGTPSGKRAQLRAPLKNKKEERVPEEQDDEVPTPEKNSEKSEEKKELVPGEKTPQQKKMFIFVAGLAVLAIIVAVITFSMPKSAPAPAQTPTNASDPAVVAAEDVYNIIRTTRDIVPGEQIASADIEKVEISSDLFNQYALAEDFAYKWDKAKDVEGLYVNSYIPKGGYLTYNNVVGTYFVENNPWETFPDDYGYLDIPVVSDFETQKSWLVGASMDLVIKKKTYSDRPTQVETPANVSGLDHSSTIAEKIIIDTYSFKNLQIINLFSKADGSTNLYYEYSRLIKIPDGEQCSYFEGIFAENKENGNAYIPTFVRVALPLDQIAAIGSLTAENTTAEITIVPSVSPYNDAQERFFAEERLLTNSIANAAYETLGVPKPAVRG